MRDLVFRDFATLTSFSHPYVDEFKTHLDSFYPNLWAHLELVPNLEPNKSRAVLSYLLSAACQCQNVLNIELGRAGLLALPREWLLSHIEEAAAPLLQAGDEWEYRRLLEVCWKLDGGLLRRLALGGLGSGNPEVREACEDCLKELGATAEAPRYAWRDPVELVAITQDGGLAKPVASTPSLAAQVVEATKQLYHTVGYEPPWIGYLAIEKDTCVGSCGFKSPPHNNRVEIAYFTFPGHESRGVATRMASELIRLAWEKMPAVTVAAQTLPEESASTSVLKKLQFRLVGTIEHPEDGQVWEWQLRNVPSDNIPGAADAA